MDFLIGPEVEKKLMDKHGVHVNEVPQCFFNKNGPYLEDTREKHKTNPPTKWFIAKTNAGRLLKVVFVYYPIEQELVIKSAFEPNQTEIDIYIDNGGDLHDDN